MDQFQFIVCEIDLALVPPDSIQLPEGFDRDAILVVSWLPQEMIKKIGLPPFGVCGSLRTDQHEITPGNFSPNQPFVETLHYLNSNHMDPDLTELAASSPEDRIAVIDQRSPDVDAAIPPADIIGVYQLTEQSVSGYEPNPNFELVTDAGMFKLTPWLRHCLTSMAEQYAAQQSS